MKNNQPHDVAATSVQTKFEQHHRTGSRSIDTAVRDCFDTLILWQTEQLLPTW